MEAFSNFFVQSLSILTIVSQLAIVFLLVIFVVRKIQPKNKLSKKIANLIANNYLVLVFLITAGASAGSFVMSEILGFPPCKLCWYQRAFMFPLFLVSAVALFTNDVRVKKYFVGLSVVGAGIAIYHLLLQAFPANIQCGPGEVSCASNPFVEFGYITIPVMSLTAFLLVLALSLFRRKD